MDMKVLSISLAVLLAAALYGAYKYSRAGYESPDYRVEMESGPFEIREYPSMVLASTPMNGSEVNEDDSFLRLFRYISGRNESETKIAMTVPVFMTEGDDDAKMSFVTPREVVDAGTPEALDPKVEIETMSGGRFATYRFSGDWRSAHADAARQKLLDWTREQGLETAGEPILASYDPPFTPRFLRRNEILVRLAG